MSKKLIKFGIGGVVVIAAVVVGAMFMTGRIGSEDVGRLTRDLRYKAEGAVESLKPGSNVGSPATARTCQGNLRSIEAAKRVVAGQSGGAMGTPVSLDAVKKAHRGSWPKCPNGGRYTLNNAGTLPRCSYGNGGNTDPSDDHIVSSF